jgi:endonuclease/exonuclease/phosphatase family metal-dependent hydrolase
MGRTTLTVASYNIHRCVGSDGRKDPRRVARVISEIDADVVGLQEVDGSFQLDGVLPGRYTMVSGPTLLRGDTTYGNTLLTSKPLTGTTLHDLSFPGREPRGAIEADIAVDSLTVRFVVTHLGLSRRERRHQAERLLELLETAVPAEPFILAGDFNEWYPRRAWYRRLERTMGRTPAPRTFPSWRPILSLDRIWVRPPSLLGTLSIHDTGLARVASDHLPVKASLRLDGDP